MDPDGQEYWTESTVIRLVVHKASGRFWGAVLKSWVNRARVLCLQENIECKAASFP